MLPGMLGRGRTWCTQPRQPARARLGLAADLQLAVERAERERAEQGQREVVTAA